MAVDEAARHGLYTRAVEVLGPEHADTLMRHLPPAGWAEVATTRDLDLLRADVRADLVELRADMADRFRQQTLALVGTMVTLTAVTAAAASLL